MLNFKKEFTLCLIFIMTSMVATIGAIASVGKADITAKFLLRPPLFLTTSRREFIAMMAAVPGSRTNAQLKIDVSQMTYVEDAYSIPPAWESNTIKYDNKGMDISRFKTIRVEMSGSGNIIVQVVDDKQGDSDRNWQYGLSLVHRVSPGKNFIDIPITELRNAAPNLDLRKITRITVHKGDMIYGWNLNRYTESLLLSNITFLESEMTKTDTGTTVRENHDRIQNYIETKRKEIRGDLQSKVNGKFELSKRLSMLSNGRLNDRVQTLKKLQEESKNKNPNAILLLRYVLMNPSQNTNLRRFSYYILKDFAKIKIYGEDVLEDFIKRGPRITDPAVIRFPVIWHKDGTDLFQYPDWNGNVEMRRYKHGENTYGVEGIITSKTEVERIVDRRIMERLAYWSIVMGIDPMKATYPIVYTETLLGAHPEKTYNIMAIHASDLYKALDDNGKRIKERLIRDYGKSSFDARLDEIIVTALILLEQGFNRFTDNGDLAFRLQGYNGYGRNPFLKNKKMSEEPMIGKRAVHVGKEISGGPLEIIAQETAKNMKMTIPRLPENLFGYRIGGANRRISYKRSALFGLGALLRIGNNI